MVKPHVFSGSNAVLPRCDASSGSMDRGVYRRRGELQAMGRKDGEIGSTGCQWEGNDFKWLMNVGECL